MAIDIYLMRHGETSYNLDGQLIGGRSNYLPLDERGKVQAKFLGERLVREGINFDNIFSSTAKRAVDTCQIVSQIIGYQDSINYSDELLELSQGDWEGRPRDEVYTPEIWRLIKEGRGSFRAPNGESLLEAGERVFNFVTNCFDPEQDVNLGFFGHGMSFKSFIAKTSGINPEMIYRISLDNCSLSHLRYIGMGHHKGWSIVKINDNSHLGEAFEANICSD